MKSFSNVHTIDLSNTKITNAGLKYLEGVHTIYLYNTKVTDVGIKYLRSTGTKEIYWKMSFMENIKNIFS